MSRKAFTVENGTSLSTAVRVGPLERPVALIFGDLSGAGDVDHVEVLIGESSASVLTTYNTDGDKFAFTCTSSSRTVFYNDELQGGCWYKLNLALADGSVAPNTASADITVYMETREYNW